MYQTLVIKNMAYLFLLVSICSYFDYSVHLFSKIVELYIMSVPVLNEEK